MPDSENTEQPPVRVMVMAVVVFDVPVADLPQKEKPGGGASWQTTDIIERGRQMYAEALEDGGALHVIASKPLNNVKIYGLTSDEAPDVLSAIDVMDVMQGVPEQAFANAMENQSLIEIEAKLFATSTMHIRVPDHINRRQLEEALNDGCQADHANLDSGIRIHRDLLMDISVPDLIENLREFFEAVIKLPAPDEYFFHRERQ